MTFLTRFKTEATGRPAIFADIFNSGRIHKTTRSILISFVSAIIALLLHSVPALAQSSAVAMPPNAHANSYGSGWECDAGYRLDGAVCGAVIVPNNAYPTNRTYGSGWECHFGFKDTGASDCIELVVPDGGYLDATGERWRCLRGYRKLAETCQQIDVPDHAYLVAKSNGSDWVCNRGFEVSAEKCTAIFVPPNAYLNGARYGLPWTCERGYVAQQGTCAAVAVPLNAYFNDETYGEKWSCERGFSKSGGGCDAIEMPANAHLDRSGNRWECHKNFQKSKGRCVLNN